MSTDCSDRVLTYFKASACDLTPLSMHREVTLLYVPVLPDPAMTLMCSSVLSKAELQRADRFATRDLREHFIQRRAFRRFCGGQVVGGKQPLSRIVFRETKNGRPYLHDLPDAWFSFSSCRFGFAGAWSLTHGIGVDLEDETRDVDASGLARQYYSKAEAQAVERAGGRQRRQAFFRLWNLKEAALKSIGEGLPLGLDVFEFELEPEIRVIGAPTGHGEPERFTAHVVDGVEFCGAMVLRNRCA
ncbi:MAG: 4'-phosphopantetheinyl transferase superfamily protein [Xanthomonadales bacterium]|jgi:4'-phosphopantetheinyl transferase|nr:4'-phosphopantetheinyl transferase superfamily protein [Xanthomonadales bacterium]MDH4002544.1 4'-phosphopantetheinyl transferase superfamily protein [Xanthomonadales bacterium]